MSPDDLDRLLSAFYRSEVPQTWPAFQPPRSTVGRAGSSSHSPGRAVLVLAAAVLLMIGLSLSSGLRPAPVSPSPTGLDENVLNAATAQGKGLTRTTVR